MCLHVRTNLLFARLNHATDLSIKRIPFAGYSDRTMRGRNLGPALLLPFENTVSLDSHDIV